MSLGQDLIFTVSNGCVKTPRSILYPYALKTLTNCTELITVTNCLGYRISYTLLEEMETENAYKVIDRQQSGIIVLE